MLQSLILSILKLKSPRKNKSILDEILHSSKDSNSVKNSEMEDDGGRCITKSLKVECDDTITEPMHLEENFQFL